MIPVSTSVLVLLLKPLKVLLAVQGVFGFGPRKGNRNELQSLSLNCFEFISFAVTCLRPFEA